jgi:hypothetical protein
VQWNKEDVYLLGLPPGVAPTIAMRWSDIPRPLKSGYVLVPAGLDTVVCPGTNLELLAHTSRGNLYRNLDE